ncbi:MAG: hypothetical protein AB7P37_11830 [Ramlibacter sp.]
MEVVTQLLSNGGRLGCLDGGSIAMAAVSGMSLGGRLGYKATLTAMKPFAKTLTKEEAFLARKAVKSDY